MVLNLSLSIVRGDSTSKEEGIRGDAYLEPWLQIE